MEFDVGVMFQSPFTLTHRCLLFTYLDTVIGHRFLEAHPLAGYETFGQHRKMLVHVELFDELTMLFGSTTTAKRTDYRRVSLECCRQVGEEDCIFIVIAVNSG
jgi:hypothetical protein